MIVSNLPRGWPYLLSFRSRGCRNPESWPVSIFDLYFWKLAHMILRNISAKARMVLVSSLWNAVIRSATSLMAQANRRIISSHIAEKSTHDEIVKALRKMTINYPNKMTLFSPGLLLGQDSNPIKTSCKIFEYVLIICMSILIIGINSVIIRTGFDCKIVSMSLVYENMKPICKDRPYQNICVKFNIQWGLFFLPKKCQKSCKKGVHAKKDPPLYILWELFWLHWCFEFN